MGDKLAGSPLSHRTKQERKTRRNVHSFSGIRTYDPGIQAVQSVHVLHHWGHCDRHILYLFNENLACSLLSPSALQYCSWSMPLALAYPAELGNTRLRNAPSTTACASSQNKKTKSDQAKKTNITARGAEQQDLQMSFLRHQKLELAKADPLHATEALAGERRFSSYSFSTSALDKVSGQRHAPAALYPREMTPPPRTNFIGGWVRLRAGLDTEAAGKILCLFRESNPGHPVCSQTLLTELPQPLFWLICFYSCEVIKDSKQFIF
jgi:hypothetical protein